MRRSLRLFAAPVVMAVALPSAVAVPIQEGKMVTFEARSEKVQAYLARPAVAGFYPGVVVIHEWWGLNDQIKGVAERLAEQGYVAIVPDLYRGKLGTDAGFAHELMRGLNENWAVDVIGAAADWLRSMDAQETRRRKGERMAVATLGFCMGGRLSLATALKGKDIQAAVMYYGSVETDKEALRPLQAPLLGIFGDEDHGIPLDQIKSFEAALKEAGKDASIRIYRGVGHAFFNESRPSYEREAAHDSWQVTEAFLREKLSAPSGAPPAGQGKRTAPPPPPEGDENPNN